MLKSLENNMEKDRVIIWDETLRDGEQAADIHFSKDEKMTILNDLDKLGVDVIDIGCPLTSKEEYEFVEQVIEKKDSMNAEIGITMRAHPDDIEFCKDLKTDNFFLFAPTSDVHIREKFKTTREEVVANLEKSAKLCKGYGKSIVFITEDSIGSDMKFLTDVIWKLAEYGCNKVILTDSCGVGEPQGFYNFIKEVIEKSPKDTIFGIHCHNDYGLAVANTLASIQAGVTVVTSTINGIGIRAGNCASEEIYAVLDKLASKKTNIDFEKLVNVCDKVEKITKIPVSPQKPITGKTVRV